MPFSLCCSYSLEKGHRPSEISQTRNKNMFIFTNKEVIRLEGDEGMDAGNFFENYLFLVFHLHIW